MASPKVHVTLSASSAHRCLSAPPLPQLEKFFPKDASPMAAEGTAAHYKLRKTLGQKVKRPASDFDNDDMEAYTDDYCSYVMEEFQKVKLSHPSATVLIEQRLDFSKYVPDGFGTGDCIIIADGMMHIIDFKYGKVVRVAAENNPQMRHYNNRTCFSQKVFCGRCGDIYHRVAYNYSDENDQVIKWLCMTGHDHDLVTFNGRAISERQLKEVCLRAFNKIIEPNRAFRAKLQNNIRHAISQVNEEQAAKLDCELDCLQILLINQTPHSKDYDKIAGEFNKVQQQRDELQLTLDSQNEVVQKNVNLQNFIDTNSKQLNEFDEHLVRQLIKKNTIQETYCEVEFQNGDSIKINL